MKKMNKLFFTMCMVGGFAVLFGSCKKNDETPSANINLPAFEEEIDGRAYIDFNNGNKFKWNGGDQVVIYNLDDENGNNSEKAIYQNTAGAEGQTTARFSYLSGDQLSAKKYGYFVFYPVDKVDPSVKLNENNYETFEVLATQNYTKVGSVVTLDPAGMAMAVDINNLGTTFSLKHIFGVLKLRIKGEGTVTSIEVEDSRYNLSGTVGMKLHEVKMATFTALQNNFIANADPDNYGPFINEWNNYRTLLGYTTQGGGKTMTLMCPEEGVALNSASETNFFIGLRPGALKYGFKVKVYLDQVGPVVFDFTGANTGDYNYDNPHYGIKAGIVKNFVLDMTQN